MNLTLNSSFAGECVTKVGELTTKMDMGCFIEKACSKFSGYMSIYAWVLICLPVIASLIIFGMKKYNEYHVSKYKRTCFGVKSVRGFEYFYYGWKDMSDFKLFVYEELLLLACFLGAIMLYLMGGFEWLRMMFPL